MCPHHVHVVIFWKVSYLLLVSCPTRFFMLTSTFHSYLPGILNLCQAMKLRENWVKLIVGLRIFFSSFMRIRVIKWGLCGSVCSLFFLVSFTVLFCVAIKQIKMSQKSNERRAARMKNLQGSMMIQELSPMQRPSVWNRMLPLVVLYNASWKWTASKKLHAELC